MNVLIVGGTGTLGRALMKHYYKTDFNDNNIICFSRDELKQQELKKEYPEVRFVIGDIRDGFPSSVEKDIDIIYHVAALKHIDVLEDNIIEGLRTNVSGTINIANQAVSNRVKKFSFSSTDKAIYPVNVYGNTKAICERYLSMLNETQSQTHFRVFRWGNVVASRGSVIQSFQKSLINEGKVYITHPDMTRFWIRIEDAVKFMIEETENPSSDGVQIPSMKSCKITDIAEVMAWKLKISHFKKEYIGLRPGEKMHEDITQNRNSFTSERYTHDEICELLQDVA